MVLHWWTGEQLDDIAKQYGFYNAFSIRTLKQEAINKAHEIFQTAEKKGRLPKRKEKNGTPEVE